jgi:hypothetical protein
VTLVGASETLTWVTVMLAWADLEGSSTLVAITE